VRNLRRDPRASYCGFTDGFFGPWVQVEGRAEIVSLPEAMDQLVAYYRAVSGEHPDWDDYRAAMVRDRRVIISIVPDRAGPDRQG
jgi:PPOX class probable F420-dependent enzyme